MNNRADGVRVAYPLFHEGGSGAIPTSALQLRLYKVPFYTTQQLNRLWHSRIPNYGRGCIRNQSDLCYAAEFDGLYYAVGIWSNPVARRFPQKEWLELRRLAVAPDAPRNTASRTLGVMARLIRNERPEVTTLVSYHDCDVHTGGIYRAAGWVATATSPGVGWNRSERYRNVASPVAPRQRWEKVIREQSVQGESNDGQATDVETGNS